MSMAEPVRLLEELRQRQRDLFRALGPGIAVTLVAFGIAFYFIEPPPPSHLTIATGSSSGRYYAFAQAYAEALQKSHVTLDVRETAGSIDNFDLLKNDSAIDLAIVQGGTEPDNVGDESIEALATLYFEPLWVFYRSDADIRQLTDLQGLRVAVGRSGSGSYALATQLLAVSGIDADDGSTTLVTEGSSWAVQAFKDGRIDAAMFVVSPDAPVVRQLLQDPDVQLLDFGRQQAYARRFPFLKDVVLEQGVIDLEDNLPAKPVRLLAPGANLVARSTLHEAIVPLLLETVVNQHHHGGYLAADKELPSVDNVSFPVNAAARRYLTHGPSFFQRHMSFWLASLLDRSKILILPLLTLLLPLVKVAPPVYRWRIRSRIYRWYGVLRKVDQQVRNNENPNFRHHARTLEAMFRELDAVHVPLSYMQEFYNLRLHIDLVLAELVRLEQQHAARTSATEPSNVEQVPSAE